MIKIKFVFSRSNDNLINLYFCVFPSREDSYLAIKRGGCKNCDDITMVTCDILQWSEQYHQSCEEHGGQKLKPACDNSIRK